MLPSNHEWREIRELPSNSSVTTCSTDLKTQQTAQSENVKRAHRRRSEIWKHELDTEQDSNRRTGDQEL